MVSEFSEEDDILDVGVTLSSKKLEADRISYRFDLLLLSVPHSWQKISKSDSLGLAHRKPSSGTVTTFDGLKERKELS